MLRTRPSILDQYRALGIRPIGGGEGDPPSGDPPNGDPPKGDDPPAWKPPASQADLDKLIEDRLGRDRKAHRSELEQAIRKEIEDEAKRKAAEEQGNFQELAEQLQAKVAELTQTIADKDAELKGKEIAALRAEIAAKHRLPKELADRLQGETADEIEADAKALAKTITVKPVETEGGKGAKGNGRAKAGATASYTFGAGLRRVPFPGSQPPPQE